MYTKTIYIITVLIIVFTLIGCRSKKDIIPEYVAEKAIIYSTGYEKDRFVLNIKKHRNYPVIKKYNWNHLSRANSIKNILDSLGALRQGIDTIICIENTSEISPMNLYQYVVKTTNDSLAIIWDRNNPFNSIPKISSFKDYVNSLERYGERTVNINKKYYSTIFSWDIPAIESLLKPSGTATGFDHIRAMRIIIDNGHILEFDCIKYGGTAFW